MAGNPVRSIIAVLGGIALVSIVGDALEFALVNAAAGGSISDMDGYVAVRNRPPILAARLASTAFAAVLAGYVAAKVAGVRELLHAGVAALVQTAALIWGFTAGEYAPFTPPWARVALVLLTGPAMMAGAWIRAGAAERGPQ